MRHHQACRWSQAELLYRKILSRDPDNIDARHFLGVLQFQTGRLDDAAASIGTALQLKVENPPAHCNLGRILLAQDKTAEAAASFRRALEHAPDFTDALSYLGSTLIAAGNLAEAVAVCRRLTLVVPQSADARFALGNAQYARRDWDAAIASYREAIALKADFAEAHSNLGSALKERGWLDLAVVSYQAALDLNPRYFEALYNLGIAQRDRGRYREAADCLRQALSLRPDSAAAHYGLGHVHCDEDRLAQARECFRQALALEPEHQAARWSLAMSQLPAVYGEGDDPAHARAAFADELARLELWFDPVRSTRGEGAVGTQQPFRLAYQEANNRALQERYGQLCSRLMSTWQQREGAHIAAVRRTGCLRVGFVSQHFRNHSVWNALLKGWLLQLDNRRFEILAFCLGNGEDAEARLARARASRFEQGNLGLHHWSQLILDAQPDVLIYPEIGMDPMAVKLASTRLAPLQVAAWGHPETTGLPTIDAYVSARDLEPEGAQENYSERLVALPNLGCYLEHGRIEPAAHGRTAWGATDDSPLLLCAGTPFKYAPQHDWIFVDIARRLRRCRFLFFTYSTIALSEKLRQRLFLAFDRAGLDAGRFVGFVPWQAKPEFLGLMSRADAFLDTIGFSGFNTALQAVECSLPIVTREGRFLRGRLASGILKRIGLSELVAADEEQYVALAVRLASDPAYRGGVRDRMRAGRHLLYGDTAPIRALEDFLAQGV